VSLCHRRQPENWGCIWYAAYAITGDGRLLEHTEEIHPVRYQIILAQHGWLFEHVYNHAYKTRATPDFWEALVASGYGDIALMLHIDSLNHPGLQHAVALWLPKEAGAFHWVSDSTRPEMVLFDDRAAFLASPYSRPYEVAYLLDASLGNWPTQSAPELFHEMKAAAGASR
jgi:hypothetical protein